MQKYGASHSEASPDSGARTSAHTLTHDYGEVWPRRRYSEEMCDRDGKKFSPIHYVPRAGVVFFAMTLWKPIGDFQTNDGTLTVVRKVVSLRTVVTRRRCC